MKLIYSSALVLLIVGLAQAGVLTQRFRRDGKYADMCMIQGTLVRPGESIKHPIMDCAEFTCGNSNGLGWIALKTCEPMSALPSPESILYKERPANLRCKWGDFVDTQAPFPKCCERRVSCVV